MFTIHKIILFKINKLYHKWKQSLREKKKKKKLDCNGQWLQLLWSPTPTEGKWERKEKAVCFFLSPNTGKSKYMSVKVGNFQFDSTSLWSSCPSSILQNLDLIHAAWSHKWSGSLFLSVISLIFWAHWVS